ncbi:MAG TPA: MMPL family transporter, partial [Brachybacterium sp.]|nr:MMPL family transporter [Brachybacterium sp.]
MSSSLYRLGRAMAAAGWKIVALWAALLIAVGVLGVGLGGTFSTDFEIPGTEAQSGIDNLATRFPEMGGTAGQVVFVADDGAPIEEHQAQIDDVMVEIGDIEGVEAAPSPFDDLSPGTRSDDGTAMIAQFQMDGQIGEFPAASVD